MADRQIQVSGALLEELIACTDALTQVVKDPTDNQKQLITRSNRAVSSAITLLRGSAGPGSFSGNEIGQYKLDPTQSPYL